MQFIECSYFYFIFKGFNTVTFGYDSDSNRWTFNAANFNILSDVNLNDVLLKNSNEYDSFAADLLTKISNIKRHLTRTSYCKEFKWFLVLEFQGKFYLGRCTAILADEIEKFLSTEFKTLLNKLYDNPDVTKTILQSIFLTFDEPMSLMEKFLSNVNEVCLWLVIEWVVFF